MSETIHTLIPEEEVEKRICEIAAQISKDYEGKSVHLICILKGSVMFSFLAAFVEVFGSRMFLPICLRAMLNFSCSPPLPMLSNVIAMP